MISESFAELVCPNGHACIIIFLGSIEWVVFCRGGTGRCGVGEVRDGAPGQALCDTGMTQTHWGSPRGTETVI